MRIFLRVFSISVCVVVLGIGVGLGWIFFYSRDLPDMKALAQFAPASGVHVSDPCLRATSFAIPYDSIGGNLRSALNAAEVGEDDPGVLSDTYRAFASRTNPPRTTLSWQISRTMFCLPSKSLNRQFEEFRTSIQLERRYSRRELFTIYANRLWFGEDLIGLETASQHFFQKEPNQLEVEEAALLAGLVRAPGRLSPIKHPDRALERRNEVIDAMVAARAMSEREGEAAKVRPLGVVTQQTR